MMDTLQTELDRSFGDGPPLRPIEVHAAAGRRALVRRRLAGGAAGLATAAVLATGWYAVSPGTQSGADRLANDPTPSATAEATADATEEPAQVSAEKPWQRGEMIRYVDDELQVRPGVVVHEHIPNPYRYKPPGLSDALDVTYKGQRHWLMIDRRPGSRGESWSSSSPSNGWASFADYVADQAGMSGASGWPETFTLDDQGRVVPTPGTQVFNRTDDPRLGPDFAPAGAPTGAAVVSVPGDEASYFVVWRVIDGELDVITTPPNDVVGATFEELLSYARAQYASGEGLR